MSPMEALKFALSQELESIRLYRELSIKHPPLKELIDFLVIEEQKHKKMIEEKITEISL